MPNQISYRSDHKITVSNFIDVLKRSTLDQRRPVDDPDRIKKMLEHGNVLITAWENEKLIGVSRALTGMQTMLILLAAPAAIAYYPKIGMKNFPHCFVLNRKS